MRKNLKNQFKKITGLLNLEVRRKFAGNFSIELEGFASVINSILAEELTMVSKERLEATALACMHVSSEKIPGDFVECGVWRGGNSILAMKVFQAFDQRDRNLWLFDTFEGMTKPSEIDVESTTGVSANEVFSTLKDVHGEGSNWCYSNVSEVIKNFREFGFASDRVNIVKGNVCNTLRVDSNIPDKISVLRLDTDWYESTLTELEVLYPRLCAGGILIIDDYGHWEGARAAVDEYFQNVKRPFFFPIDYTGRIGVKI